jgi:DNA mismatch endonuclease (patch repair protein)
MDVLSPEQRSRCMSAVRSRDTKPEMQLRRALHALGFRYRLHEKSLPGKPDLVFSSRRAVIFVHGCFWHRHNCKSGRSLPVTRADFWRNKLKRNVQRDVRIKKALRKLKWNVIVIWECELASGSMESSLLRVVKVLRSDTIHMRTNERFSRTAASRLKS